MPNLSVISKSKHANHYWLRASGYNFAAEDSLCPLVISEVSTACMSLPIAFTVQNEEFIPVAIQGLQAKKNLFVLNDNSWFSSYIPALYRGYPFSLASSDEGNEVLCINSDALRKIEEEGAENIFDSEGSPSATVQQIFDFLTKVSQSRKITRSICAQLAEMQLIVPWEIKLELEEENQEINGLFRIDENAFNKLSADKLCALRDSGGLNLVYCQLLSMQKIAVLINLYKSILKLGNPTLPKELDLDYLNDSDSLSFDNF